MALNYSSLVTGEPEHFLKLFYWPLGFLCMCAVISLFIYLLRVLAFFSLITKHSLHI